MDIISFYVIAIKPFPNTLLEYLRVPTPQIPVLSFYQTTPLIQAMKTGKVTVLSSTDLGISSCEAKFDQTGVFFSGKTWISWVQCEEISSHENNCFSVINNTLKAIKGFSGLTNRSFSLMPTKTAPAMIVAGFPMHRIKDTDPIWAASAMVNTISPLRGRVLDTATGLGYTAILAARSAEKIVTIELDPLAQEMALVNPWSTELFENPKITRVIGDAVTEIKNFPDASFDRIIHDPPALSLAGDMYSGIFYKHLFRVLKPGGRVFHYIGDPQSTSGKRTTKGVIKRLHEAGFRQVVPEPTAFGVRASR
jgi:predicted methyltransferase